MRKSEWIELRGNALWAGGVRTLEVNKLRNAHVCARSLILAVVLCDIVAVNQPLPSHSRATFYTTNLRAAFETDTGR